MAYTSDFIQVLTSGGETKYWPYPKAWTIAEGNAAFIALSAIQKEQQMLTARYPVEAGNEYYVKGGEAVGALPPVQNIFTIEVEGTRPDYLSLSVASYDAVNGWVYLNDSANPDNQNRGGSWVWMYFVDNEWMTRAQFLARPFQRNFPHLVEKFLVDTSKQRKFWRHQNETLGALDQVTFRYY